MSVKSTFLLVLFAILNSSFFVSSLSVYEKFDDVDSLIQVGVLFRHGDRTPISDSWPTDIYYKNYSIFPEGKGELTNKGKMRLYQLGKWFRQRYSNFLPSYYRPSDILVKSTDVDRTLMSAQCNLAGLYPPTESQTWNEALLWQPIPIHTTPEKDDPILTGEVACAARDYLTDQLLNSEEFKTLNSEHAELYRNLSVLTGTNISDFTTMSWLYSTISIYESYNLTIPYWVDTYMTEISALAGVKFKVNTYTPQMARLRIGPFFNYFLTKLEEASAKFLMFSAHDSTVADVLNAMGAFNDVTPEFGSSIIWEIRKNSVNNTYLNTFFKNSTHFEQVRVFDCDFDCDFEEFKQFLQPIAVDVDTWVKECSEVPDISFNKFERVVEKIDFEDMLENIL